MTTVAAIVKVVGVTIMLRMGPTRRGAAWRILTLHYISLSRVYLDAIWMVMHLRYFGVSVTQSGTRAGGFHQDGCQGWDGVHLARC